MLCSTARLPSTMPTGNSPETAESGTQNCWFPMVSTIKGCHPLLPNLNCCQQGQELVILEWLEFQDHIDTYFIEIILQILATTPIHLVSHTPRSTSPSTKAAVIPQLLNSWWLVQPDNSLQSGYWSDSSLIPRPYQPQCWSLSVSRVGKEGLVTSVMFPCSLQEFVQSQ